MWFIQISVVLHRQIRPLPGGGNGYVGFYITNNWMEYVGACLTGPLIAGTSYTIDFYTALGTGTPSATLALFGTPDCNDLPWVGTSCPIGNGSWTTLSTQSVTYGTAGPWQQVTMTFTPSVNIEAIALGGDCNTGTGFLDYYYVDELTLNSTASFGGITSTGNVCTNDLMLYENFINPGDSTQWFYNGVAILGADKDSLDGMIYGAGKYTAVNYIGTTCEQVTFVVPPPDYPTSFFINPNVGTCLDDVYFFVNDTAVSVEPITSWEWFPGDGSGPLSTYHLSHTYNTPGDYNLDLVVSSDVGCTDTSSAIITVHPLSSPAFSMEYDGITYNLSPDDTVTLCGLGTIQFNDLSTILAPDTIVQYDWDFGNLLTSNLASPSMNYSSTGYYNVTLTTTTNAGCFEDFSAVIRVLPKPVAAFVLPTEECLNLDIAPTNTSSINGGSIIDYDWSFGDATNSSLFSPTHAYALDGNYTVKLIVESDLGCMDSLIQNIDIWPVPVADFQANEHCQNETVNFIDQSTISSGSITGWQWDLGDNTGSGQNNISHDYATDSTYTVTLIALSDHGCRDTFSLPYIIYPVPVNDFTVDNACENALVNIVNNSSINSGSIQQFNWNLDNNVTSNLHTPLGHSYTTDGNYTISLELISDQGCISEDHSGDRSV